MDNNDIALSFDTAEYYSLQEASEYLNRKYKTDSITPKKILKRIYEFNLNIYVYGRGFSLMGTHCLDDIDILSELDDSSEHYKDYLHRIDLYLFYCDIKPSIFCKEKGVFLQLSKRNIAQLLFLNHTQINNEWLDVKGLLRHDNLNADPSNVDVFLDPSDIPINHQSKNYNSNAVRIVESSYQPIIPKDDIETIGLQKLLDNINLKVQEHRYFDNTDVECYEGTNHDYNDKETVALTLEVTTEDILILHKDIENLESLIIKKKQSVETTEQLFKKKGVSPKLLKAKLIADVHAQNLWSKDYDKQIRIGEMCELIWNYLVDTDYRDMLPEKKESLKSWLSLIPKHASESGRPSS